jgi:hypothetical protein
MPRRFQRIYFCRLSPLNALNAFHNIFLESITFPFMAMEPDHIRIANKKSLERFKEDYFPPR